MRFLTLCSFDNYIDANLLLGRLQEEGINCWLQDEHTVTIDPILTNAIGGIKLMVYFSQVERARELLHNWQQQPALRCPVCGSGMVQRKQTKLQPVRWLADLFRMLSGKAAFQTPAGLACLNCGAEFSEAAQAASEQ